MNARFVGSASNIVVCGKSEIVYDSFISVNGEPLVKATFDLSRCPIDLVSDMVRILEKSGMKLFRNV